MVGVLQGRIRVLHVEADPDITKATASALADEVDRLTVETARTTSEGLSKLAEGEVDCVISAYELPECDGVEFLEAVREEYPDLPFVLFTGNDSAAVASEAISAGVSEYLRKRTGPEQYAHLAETVLDAVEDAREERTRRHILSAIETAAEGLGILDADGEFRYVNGTYASLYGYDREELIGKHWGRLYPAGQIREIEEEVLPRVESDGYWCGETVGVRADGSRMHGEHTFARTGDGDLVCTVVDVSEGRNWDRAIEKLHSTARTLLQAETTTEVAEIVVDAVEGILELSTNGFYVYDSTTGVLRPAAVSDQATELIPEIPTFQSGEGLVWDAFHAGKTEQYDDVTAVSGHYNPKTPIRSEIIVPVGDHGVLIIGAAEAGAFDSMDVSLAETVGTHAETALNRIERERQLEQQREQLQEEQQFVESIFGALPDVLYAFDTDGYLLRWNEPLETVVGYSEEEINEMHVTEFVPDDEVEDIASNFRRILEERRTVTIESAYRTKDGDRIPYEFTGSPLEDADGDLRGVTGIGRDITDRKERERRLKTLNETAQELMGAETRVEIGEIGVGAAAEILGLDANAIHLCDEEQSGLVPVAHTDALVELVGDPPTFTGEESIAWRVYQRGETLAVDDVREDPDVYDTDTDVRSELYIPIGKHGVLIVGSGRTEAFNEQDIVLGEILVGTVAAALEQVERTEQLRARETELTNQNERLEEFASVVSHDLRNPLNVAEARLGVAMEECNSEHLERVERMHSRMNRLIDDLLTLAREGDRVSGLRPVDLETIVERCWRNVDTTGATLLVEANRTIEADQSQFQQLLENLIRNAIEHGGQDVTVTVGELPDGFYLEDDGPGIPSDEREAVFGTGYSTTDDGSGFGLAIVKQVADVHGWELRLVEGSDGGARFEITGLGAGAESPD